MRVTIVSKVDKFSPQTINHCCATFTSRTSRMSRVKPFTGRINATDIDKEEEYKSKAFNLRTVYSIFFCYLN